MKELVSTHYHQMQYYLVLFPQRFGQLSINRLGQGEITTHCAVEKIARQWVCRIRAENLIAGLSVDHNRGEHPRRGGALLIRTDRQGVPLG